ncbi:SO2930 family diheme c-type cytochrome [Qipengyuania sediminis]|uniref:SO2930 family diheme c-type cytochrome n=1 Tax=Qipengyuania sediminis TaxID=1532023 RepID=UPI00105A8A2C|nr:SO2930 family diheme c-type cytochrome [Qipengyuania sediminis]
MGKRVALLAAAALTFAGALTVQAAPSPRVADAAILAEGMPPLLSQYGFFADLAAQRPVAGVVPYRLNTPLWSDGAEKLRFVYVPGGQTAKGRGEGLLDLPVGTALIKTFAFTQGGKRRLIETRLLLHRASGWVALPYLWNAEQTEARLALAGARLPLTTSAGQAISYRVPNKNQCKECHQVGGAVIPIGPKARNLSARWLADFVAAGHLDAVPAGADVFPLWEDRAKAPVAKAARAYLDVNCAHCHRPQASASNSGLDLRWEQADRSLLGIMKRPVAAGRGAGAMLFDVVPGKPDESILAHRMASAEPGVAMPELGKDTVDTEAVAVIRRWIAEGAQ